MIGSKDNSTRFTSIALIDEWATRIMEAVVDIDHIEIGEIPRTVYPFYTDVGKNKTKRDGEHPQLHQVPPHGLFPNQVGQRNELLNEGSIFQNTVV